MSDTIDLGGNIKLSGFSDVDPTSMIIVKKIVGNIARELQEQQSVSEFHLNLSRDNKNITIHANITGSKVFSGTATETNLFFAINKALEGVKNQQ